MARHYAVDCQLGGQIGPVPFREGAYNNHDGTIAAPSNAMEDLVHKVVAFNEEVKQRT